MKVSALHLHPQIGCSLALSTGTTSKEPKKPLLAFRVPVVATREVAWIRVSMLCWSYLSNEVTKHSSGTGVVGGSGGLLWSGRMECAEDSGI